MLNNGPSLEIQNLRDRLSGDPQRPGYHFLPPANWMNDPNGLIQWRGQYHLFYQHNPNGPFHSLIHWGHAVSSDLVYWTDMPLALTPMPGGSDAEGCFSGCAVDNEGVPTLLYTGVSPQVVCMATGSDDLTTWQTHPQSPLIEAAPPEIAARNEGHFRDPFVWKENGWWYMVIGTKKEGEGGLILLYRSPDLFNWEYLKPLLRGDIHQKEPVWTAAMWECPNFLDFGDKRVLIFSIQDNSGKLLHPLAYIGNYNNLNHDFTPQSQDLLVHGGYFYAPQVMRDDHGRYLMWGWLQEGRPQTVSNAAGWAGVMSLPIIVSLDEAENLHLEPAPELAKLRGDHYRFTNFEITPDPDKENDLLKDIQGANLEILAEFEPGQPGEFEFKLRASPDDQEQTRLVYRPEQQELVLERGQSSLKADVDRNSSVIPVKLKEGEALKLHIFLDGSVVEVFVNERVCLASRIYPARNDSLKLGLRCSKGLAFVKSLEIWQLNTIWG